MQAEGTFVAINNRVSQSVPHLHVHIVPRKKGDGLRGFFWPRQKYQDEEQMRQVQAAIVDALSRVAGVSPMSLETLDYRKRCRVALPWSDDTLWSSCRRFDGYLWTVAKRSQFEEQR